MFGRKMEERVGGQHAGDAFGKGRWIRRAWGFLLHGVQSSEGLEWFDRFVEDWNSYRDSSKLAARHGCIVRLGSPPGCIPG